MKCPTPLRDRALLDYIQEQHDAISATRRPGSFAVEFHYDNAGALTVIHRGPVVRVHVADSRREGLTLD